MDEKFLFVSHWPKGVWLRHICYMFLFSFDKHNTYKYTGLDLSPKSMVLGLKTIEFKHIAEPDQSHWLSYTAIQNTRFLKSNLFSS